MATKLNIKDNLKFLTVASSNMQKMSAQLEQYLSEVFDKNKVYYSRKNVFGQIINFIKDLSAVIFYYISKSTTEANIVTATKDVSLKHFAELSGYNTVRYISTTGAVLFHFNPDAASEVGNTIIIRKYAELKCQANGLTYLIDIADDHKRISLQQSDLILSVIEGTVKSQTFYSTGESLFTINVDETDHIENSHVVVYVDGEKWEQFNSIVEMALNTKGYIIRTGYTNAIDIIFGNDLNGVIPKRGATILVEYIVSQGEDGNIDESVKAEFTPLSGFYDTASNEIGMADICTCVNESGFLNGSYGDSAEVLREMIGFNDRTMVLADSKNYEAFLSRYSTISRVHIWSPEDNLNIKNFIIFPNLQAQLSSNKEYLTMSLDKFFLSSKQKEDIINCIKESGKSYQNHELRFIDPIIRRYAILVYVDIGNEVISEIKSKTEDAIIDIFIDNTFKKFSQKVKLDIVKADIVKAIRNALPTANSITVHILSSENEEAKIRGWYYPYEKVYLQSGNVVDTSKKVTIDGDTDPLLGLSENNDIIAERLDIIPVLRGGFKIKSKIDGNTVETKLDNAIYTYVKSSAGWQLLTQ